MRVQQPGRAGDLPLRGLLEFSGDIREGGNAVALHGSIKMLSPSLKERICSWQTVVRS